MSKKNLLYYPDLNVQVPYAAFDSNAYLALPNRVVGFEVPNIELEIYVYIPNHAFTTYYLVNINSHDTGVPGNWRHAGLNLYYSHDNHDFTLTFQVTKTGGANVKIIYIVDKDLVVNMWHKIKATYIGTYVRLYLDDVLVKGGDVTSVLAWHDDPLAWSAVGKRVLYGAYGSASLYLGTKILYVKYYEVDSNGNRISELINLPFTEGAGPTAHNIGADAPNSSEFTWTSYTDPNQWGLRYHDKYSIPYRWQDGVYNQEYESGKFRDNPIIPVIGVDQYGNFPSNRDEIDTLGHRYSRTENFTGESPLVKTSRIYVEYSGLVRSVLFRFKGVNELTSNERSKVQAFVDGLVIDGIWDKIDEFWWAMGIGSKAKSLIGFIGQINLPEVGTITFDASGWSGFSGSDYLLPSKQLNSLSNYSKDNALVGLYLFGGGNNPIYAQNGSIYLKISTGTNNVINSGTNFTGNAFDAGGSFLCNIRDSSTTVKSFKAGSNEIDVSGNNSSGVPSANFLIGKNSIGGSYTGKIGCVIIGSAIGVDQIKLNARIQTLLS